MSAPRPGRSVLSTVFRGAVTLGGERMRITRPFEDLREKKEKKEKKEKETDDSKRKNEPRR
jgi:hypothetical protein